MNDAAWKRVLIGPESTLRDAIAAIDSESFQIALVVDAERRLLGTVTDGDVRRAILRGVALECPVGELMHRTPRVARHGDSRDGILTLMRNNHLHQIPLIDEDGRVVGLETIDDVLSTNPNDHWVVLMAGGLGSRLYPLTENTPKPLLMVGNKPLLETIIETLVAHGFRRVFIAVNYLADAVVNEIGTGSRWGAEISYLREEQRMGTAGALALLPEKPTSPVLVMNADILTNLNFRHLMTYHAEQACEATMCVWEHSIEVPYGVVEMSEHRLLRITEKPVQRHFINAGIYVLAPEAIERVPTGTRTDMTQLADAIIADARQVAVFPIREFWLDIGRHEDYAAAATHYEKLF